MITYLLSEASYSEVSLEIASNIMQYLVSIDKTLDLLVLILAVCFVAFLVLVFDLSRKLK